MDLSKRRFKDDVKQDATSHKYPVQKWSQRSLVLTDLPNQMVTIEGATVTEGENFIAIEWNKRTDPIQTVMNNDFRSKRLLPEDGHSKYFVGAEFKTKLRRGEEPGEVVGGHYSWSYKAVFSRSGQDMIGEVEIGEIKWNPLEDE